MDVVRIVGELLPILKEREMGLLVENLSLKFTGADGRKDDWSGAIKTFFSWGECQFIYPLSRLLELHDSEPKLSSR